MLAILVLSGYPGHKVPPAPFFGFDKVVHVGIYFVLSILILFGWTFKNIDKKIYKIVNFYTVVFGISFGGFMEICQHYIFINRSGNWYDFIANSIGATLGVFLFPIFLKFLPLKR